MVASRKVPVTAPTGRPAPKVVKQKTTDGTTTPQNELAKGSKIKTAKVPKSRKRKQRQSNGLVEFLTKALTLFVIIYTFSVCPNDNDLDKPICKALSIYRRYILEPYLLPPVQSLIQSSYVAPHLARLQPVYYRVLDTAQPVALRTQSEWNSRVVPQWNARVVPQWEAKVVPLWNAHVAPHVRRAESIILPYYIRANGEYNRRLAPHLRTANKNLQKWRSQAEPYVILAAAKTQHAYHAAKPYIMPVWLQFKALIKHLLLQLQAKRRQFVDPHVARIWENIKELSTGAVTTPTTSAPKGEYSAEVIPNVVSSMEPSVSIPEATAEPEVFAASVIAESVLGTSVEFTLTEEAIPEETFTEEVAPTEEAFAGEEIVESTTTTASEVSGTSHEIETEAPVAEAIESIVSVASSAVAIEASTVVEAGSSFVAESAVPEATPEAIEEGVFETTSSAAVKETLEPVAPTTPAFDEEEDDDAWLKELEIDAPPISEEVFVDQQQQGPTPEELAEKKRLFAEETAAKRIEIMGRHDGWEDKLDDAAYEKEVYLRTTLAELRRNAVAELQESPEIRKQVDGFVADAEKYLRGADVYLKNLSKENRKNEEKVALWERVVGKVETKFYESLDKTQSYMNEWFRGIVAKEVEEVHKAGKEIRSLAEQAQADLGLDYAWLDDVTYEDWSRYHALVHAAENFTAECHSIQNGTHESPAPNPIIAAVHDLQAEIQDVVVGFETRLRRTKRVGERTFGSATPAEEEAPIVAPEVSILPIEPEVAPGVKYIPPFIIGRGKEEVLEALNKVPLEKTEAEPTPNVEVVHEEL